MLILSFSCKTKPPIEKAEIIEKKEIQKDPFLGVYTINFNNSKSSLTSYSVEFKKNKKARVIIFKKHKNKPIIIHGKYLFSKENKNIIILYFPKNIPSEFFIKNKDGTLSLLNENKKNYKGRKANIFNLKKIK